MNPQDLRRDQWGKPINTPYKEFLEQLCASQQDVSSSTFDYQAIAEYGQTVGQSDVNYFANQHLETRRVGSSRLCSKSQCRVGRRRYVRDYIVIPQQKSNRGRRRSQQPNLKSGRAVPLTEYNEEHPCDPVFLVPSAYIKRGVRYMQETPVALGCCSSSMMRNP
ncbi:hypothetical protein LZ30DRAFT_23053 [Colletotrichum cereale]|nr:hypothetical protein LZ30DRAFT_23053 [Colletotrichum cereale]